LVDIGLPVGLIFAVVGDVEGAATGEKVGDVGVPVGDVEGAPTG